MGHYVGSRFGQDTPSRIAVSTELLLEASEMPAEPMYQSLIPFYPPSITTGSDPSAGSLAAATTDDWKIYPDRLDLFCYQGDDVQIPLYFVDAARPTLDMSNENDFEWKGQIRIVHAYRSTLVHNFTIESSLITPTPPDTVNQTLVTLFLPRFHNQYPGRYSWDLFSTSPFEGPTFPQPADVADEDWPMTDQVKTWLYGYFYCVPRVTTTDWLPMPSTAVSAGSTVIVTPTGTYGPNGRVP